MLLPVSQHLLSQNVSSWHTILVLLRGQPTLHVEPCESAALVNLLVRAVVSYQEPVLLEVLLEKHLVAVPRRKHLFVDLSSGELVRGVIAVRNWSWVLEHGCTTQTFHYYCGSGRIHNQNGGRGLW